MINSLRGRLTIWYVGTFTVAFLVFSLGIYFLVSRILYDRLDTTLNATLRIASQSVSSYKPSDSVAPSLAGALSDPGIPNQVIMLMDATGRVLSKKPASSPVPPRLPQALHPADFPQLYQLAESRPDADDSCRGVYQRVLNASTGSYYLVAVIASDELLSDELDTLQNVLTGAVLLTLFLAGGGGWLLARRSLSPLAAMTLAAERITASNLTERVRVNNSRDELGRLASTFNALLMRLDRAFSQQRQFMADASHELRSPLSVVRTCAQVTLQKNRRKEPEYRESLAIIEQQATRLSRIVDDMFALARADMKQLPLSLSSFYLDELLAELVRASSVLGESKRIRVMMEPMPEAPFCGDEALLRQMFLNLIDNAVKFTPSGGTVKVGLSRVGERYEITITDNGPGIPVEAQPHIFERFYRVDQARAEAPHSGAGLGLPIARSIAELHHGELNLQDSGPEGTTFVVRLPCDR